MSAALDFPVTYRTPFEIVNSFLNRAPVDLDGMATRLGITVKYDRAMAANLSGSIGRVRDGYEITVNASDPAVRQRFTLAHEIAHFLLHRDLLDHLVADDRMYRSGLSNVFERQANKLAGELLMPANLVRLAYSAGGSEAARLAFLFRVSDQAMQIRLRELRLNHA